MVISRGNRFAYASTLALYVHADDDYSLSQITATQKNTIMAFDWHPADARVFAVCTNDDVARVYRDGAETHEVRFPQHGLRHVSWDRHSTETLVVAAGKDLYKARLKEGGGSTTQKVGWSNTGLVTCFARHPRNNRQCAAGTDAGTVWLYDAESGRTLPLVRVFEGAVHSAQFDPKSLDYLLVATAGGVITLWNVDGSGEAPGVTSAKKPTQLMEFAKQASGLSACMWVDSSPGTFISASEKHGALKVWNVSNQSPQHSIAASEGAVTSLCCLDDGSGRVAVAFRSGDVAVFDTKHRRRLWKKGPGHTETVFACVFNPVDPNQVVSCSFDGTVRLWNARNLECVKTFHTADAPRPSTVGGVRVPNAEGFGGGERKNEPGKGSMYTCAVSCDGAIVCGAGFEGDLYFFDVHSGRVLPPMDIAPRRAGTVHKVVAHPTEPGVFACASLDGSAHVVHYAGSVLVTLLHNTPVCGVAFDPLDPRVMATATEGGWVGLHVAERGFVPERRSPPGSIAATAITATTTKLTAAEGGHSAKVYGATFSPLVPGRLLSVSDDATARAWTVLEQRNGAFACVAKPVVLVGHTDKVRAHAWHPELADACFTGSWDGSIRTWDVVSGACLQVTRVHLADVYDIGTHRDAPFRAVTCSRDSTMRFWSTERMVPSAKLRAVMGAEIPAAPAAGDAANGAGSLAVSSRDGPEGSVFSRGGARNGLENGDGGRRHGGRLSRSLTGSAIGGGAVARRAAAAPSACHKHEALFAALSGYASAEELWRLARIEALGEGEARGPAEDAAGAVVTPHACEVRAILQARADAAETRNAGASGRDASSRRRVGTRDAEARERADARLRLGDVASYCEACVAMGDWDAAIAAAPAVSLAYWAELAERRAEAIAREGGDAEQASRMLLVAGKPADAAAALASAGREDDAFAVACTADAGGFQAPTQGAMARSPRSVAAFGVGSFEDRRRERNLSAPTGRTDPFPADGAEAPRSRSASVDFGENAGAAGKLAPLSPLGGASGNSLASLSPLPPLRVAGKMKMLAAAARADGARATKAKGDDGDEKDDDAAGMPPLTSSRPPMAPASPKEKKCAETVSASARSVREAQASRRLAHGDAVGAAAAHLSVGNATGAAKALLRGAQVEMAAALMLSLPSTSFSLGTGLGGLAGGVAASDAARALLAARACEFGEWDLALEAAAACENQAERRWRARLVAARRAAEDPEEAREARFAERCAQASGGWDKEETRVSPLALVASKSLASALLGDIETAAETLVAAACDELANTGPSARWDAAGLRRASSVLNVIALARNADRYDPKTRVEVTTLRCYLSALALHSAGYTPAQRSLFHHARSALKSSKAFSRFPHPAAFVSLQELARMASVYPVDAAEGLTEISTAPAVSPALRAAAGAVLNDIAVREDVEDKAPPPLAAAALGAFYNGVVDWQCPDKMPMEEALRAAAYWDAGGFTTANAFEAPL